jgi:hypothetical protein
MITRTAERAKVVLSQWTGTPTVYHSGSRPRRSGGGRLDHILAMSDFTVPKGG